MIRMKGKGVVSLKDSIDCLTMKSDLIIMHSTEFTESVYLSRCEADCINIYFTMSFSTLVLGKIGC